MKEIIVTTHAAQRMKERTPFPQEAYQRIAEYAYIRANSKSGEPNSALSSWLNTIAADRDLRMIKAGEWSARLYSKFIYIYTEHDDKIFLVTVYEFKPYEVNKHIGKMYGGIRK